MRYTRKSITDHYSEMQLTTASDKKHIVLLHKKAVSLLEQTSSSNLSFEEKREICDKAQNILAQLQISLKDEKTELTDSLFSLYDYLHTKLESTEKNQILEAIEILSPLAETFSELLKRK